MPEQNSEEWFIKTLIGYLCDHSEEVEIKRTRDDVGELLTVRVNKRDMGKIIGKEGVTAAALRTIVRNLSMRNGTKVSLKILEPYTDGQNTMREAFSRLEA